MKIGDLVKLKTDDKFVGVVVNMQLQGDSPYKNLGKFIHIFCEDTIYRSYEFDVEIISEG